VKEGGKAAEVINSISCTFEFSDAARLDDTVTGWTFSDAPQIQLTIDVLGSLIPV
jgi:hypothetical protein